MIWVKRILPFVVIFAVWIGYSKISDRSKQDDERRVKKYALVAAKIWHSGATLKETPELFPTVRDSLFVANDIDSLEFQQYLKEQRELPEKYYEFTRWLQYYSDSLAKVFEAEADSTATDTTSDSSSFEE